MCLSSEKKAEKADNGMILPTSSHPFVPKTCSTRSSYS
jgi:hypothetical protein